MKEDKMFFYKTYYGPHFTLDVQWERLKCDGIPRYILKDKLLKIRTPNSYGDTCLHSLNFPMCCPQKPRYCKAMFCSNVFYLTKYSFIETMSFFLIQFSVDIIFGTSIEEERARAVC